MSDCNCESSCEWRIMAPSEVLSELSCEPCIADHFIVSCGEDWFAIPTAVCPMNTLTIAMLDEGIDPYLLLPLPMSPQLGEVKS